MRVATMSSGSTTVVTTPAPSGAKDIPAKPTVDQTQCLMQKIVGAASTLVDNSTEVCKRVNEEWGHNAYSVYRSTLKMAVNTSWGGHATSHNVDIDIAPFDSGTFYIRGASNISQNSAVRDVTVQVLTKHLSSEGLAADESLKPDVSALYEIDWWAMYAMIGFVEACIAKHMMWGGTPDESLKTFLQAMVATYPAPGAQQGPLAFSEPHEKWSFGYLAQDMNEAWYGWHAQKATQRSQARLDPSYASFWIPKGGANDPRLHCVAALFRLCKPFFGDDFVFQPVGDVDRAHAADPTLREFQNTLEMLLGVLDAAHGESDPALARMFFTQGLGGAIRVHSSYSEGGVVRKAARHCWAAQPHGTLWTYAGTISTVPGWTRMCVEEPKNFIHAAGWLTLSLTLAVQQSLSIDGPLVLVYGVDPEEVDDVVSSYSKYGDGVYISTQPMPDRRAVAEIMSARLESDEARKQLNAGMKWIYGTGAGSRAREYLLNGLAASGIRVRFKRRMDDGHYNEVDGRERHGHAVGFIDRFLDPELAVALGLPKNGAAILRGSHKANVVDLLAKIENGADIRDDALLTAMAVVGEEDGFMDLSGIWVRPKNRSRGIVETIDGRLHKVKRGGRTLGSFTWNQHGRLPPYHSLSIVELDDCELILHNGVVGEVSCQWVRTGSGNNCLLALNPHCASAVDLDASA